jgi:mannose-6-phosphate isomerase-like protein (cupin superfamily)
MTETTTNHRDIPRRRDYVLGQDFRATILTTAAETEGRHDLTYGVQPAGATTPLHVHTRYDERFFVVSGSMTIWAGREKVSLGPGDFYAVPKGTPHAIQAGPEGASALNISSPASFAELTTRAGTPAHLATADTAFAADEFTAASAELGDVILGPPGATPDGAPE